MAKQNNRARIVNHTGRKWNKALRKKSLFDAKISNRERKERMENSDREKIRINLADKQDSEKLFNYVAINTGWSAIPMHGLCKGIDSEEEKQALFNIRESMITNANTILFTIKSIELGEKNPTDDSVVTMINESLEWWEGQRRALIDVLRKQHDIPEATNA